MRFFFLRILLPLLLFLLLRSIMKTVVSGMGSQTARGGNNPASPTVAPGGDLKKDPVCGAYVSPAASVTSKVNGAVLHFCSTECRDKYKVAS